MKSHPLTLRTLALTMLLSVATIGIARADHIPITGFSTNNEGIVAWNVSPTNGTVEAPRLGHELTWLRGVPPSPAYHAYYYLASREHDGIDVNSGGAFRAQTPVGFSRLATALATNGFNISQLRVRFGLMSLGEDGTNDWSYDVAEVVETRRYTGGHIRVQLAGQDLVAGAMPQLLLRIGYNNLGNHLDDQISATTGSFNPTNSSAGSSAQVQAVAAAFLADVGAGSLRLVMDSFQPAIQNELNQPEKGRLGGFFDMTNGRLDLDTPSFPADEVIPLPAPPICTPLIMNTDISATETWFVKAIGGTLDFHLVARPVNTNDPENVVARIYDGTGVLLGVTNVSYTATEAATNGLGWEKSVSMSFPGRPVGETLRVDITTPAPTPVTQPHYKLGFEGARWLAFPSPGFPSLEHEFARWRVNVRTNEDLKLDLSTNNCPTPATNLFIRLLDPDGNEVIATNMPINISPFAFPEINIPSAKPGAWAIEIHELGGGDHYRLSKVSGADTYIYAGWRASANGIKRGFVTLDGIAPLHDIPFNVNFYRQRVVLGIATNEFLGSTMTTTGGVFEAKHLPNGIYEVEVVPVIPGLSTAPRQTDVLMCGRPVTNLFAFTTITPTVGALDASVREGNSGTTNLAFPIILSAPSTQTVTVTLMTSSGFGTATEGVDYVASSNTLTFLPGVTSNVFVVPINGDTTFERTETVRVSLSASTNVFLFTNSTDGFIINDDLPRTPRFLSANRFFDGRFELGLGEAEDNTDYVVEATFDLRNWFPVSTNRPAAGFTTVRDDSSTNSVRRFYRAVYREQPFNGSGNSGGGQTPASLLRPRTNAQSVRDPVCGRPTAAQ